MVTLGDVSIQLLKPAKDLADWKFPLSGILENYYTLLEEPCDVNFGEAGLVIQNSTDVYVRRIERLHQLLKQAIEEEEKNSGHKVKTKKSHGNFDDFALIDLENDVGTRNIDKKDSQGQKKVKLLSRQFTQLENNMARTSDLIKVHDLTGEEIGKKYDFRCNQSVNTNGMLVDELTSYDFMCMPSPFIREDRNSMSTSSELKSLRTATSGYQSDTRFQIDNDKVMLHEDMPEVISEDIPEDIHDEEIECSFSPVENVMENQPEFVDDNENMTNSCSEFSPVNDDDLSRIDAEVDMPREEHTELNTVENVDDSLIENGKQVTENEKESANLDENIEPTEVNERMQRKRRLSRKKNRKDDEWKSRIKSSRCKSDLSKDIWKLMPMTKGVKKDFNNDACVLKIPEWISPIASRLRKRRREPENDKPECLVKFMLREKSLAMQKEVQVPPTPKFERLQKHELEDFMKNLDDCLSMFGTEDMNGNTTRENVIAPVDDVQCFQTVPDTNGEPLDFCVSSNGRGESVENDENEIERTRSRCSSFADFAPSSPVGDNDPIEISPYSSHNCSLSNYESMIEEEMRQIFNDEDSTELCRTVTNWHAFVQSRLSNSENQDEFRIHEYTSHIIRTLQEHEQHNSTFHNIVRGKPPFEVPRYFLASLQLANTYDVEIKDNCDNVELKLLSDKGDAKQTK